MAAPVALIGAVAAVVDRLFPDPAQRDAARLKLLELAAQGELAQLEVAKTEAQHPSLFVAGARPGFMWASVFIVVFNFIVAPLLSWFAALYSADLPAIPVLDFEYLSPILLGMLGLGGYRTFEKYHEVDTKSVIQNKKAR